MRGVARYTSYQGDSVYSGGNMALSNLGRFVVGKVVIVTGAASGMGRATARLFADEGASVALIDVNEEPLQAVLGEIRDAGYNAEAWTLDLLNRMAIGPTVDAIASHFGSIDILINNVNYPSTARRGPL